MLVISISHDFNTHHGNGASSSKHVLLLLDAMVSAYGLLLLDAYGLLKLQCSMLQKLPQMLNALMSAGRAVTACVLAASCLLRSCCTISSLLQSWTLLQDEFEASNACAYEMEKRLEERFVEVRADVSLATAECKQQTLSEVVHTTKLQLDNLQERFTNRIQGDFEEFSRLC